MYLGIDCGTQGTKALLLDAAGGRVLGVGSAAHDMISGPHGRREQDPAQWRHALAEAVAQALKAAGVDGQHVLGLGVSGQQHGLVMLDAQGQVLRPAKLWCDTESAPQNASLLEWLGGPQGSLERLGLVIAPGYTVSKLLWSREHFPELFARAQHIMLPHDYLNFWLTGEHCAEYGDASGTGYFNIRTRRWDLDLLRHISPDGRLEMALPRLVEADQAVGRLRPHVARELGLNPAAWVASGGGDNMMGAIGTGNIQPGHITMSLGSSGTVYAYADHPLVSEEGAVAAFCSSSGGWLPLICTMNLTNATGLVRELLQLDQPTFDQHLRSTPIGAEGVLMLPFFNGERVPALPDATASLHGLTSTNFTAANLCRAAVEGTTFGLRYGLDLLRASGLPSHSIRLTGGGSKNPLWRQMVADIMATPVVCTEEPEAAALGAAIQAAWCAEGGGQQLLAALCERCVRLAPSSHHQPQPETVAAYAPVYDAYRQQVLAL
ncbi:MULTISPECIES: xylulokinase [unclassified Pseudomonas]|uniref:xylulokinase n=1 Tax=unclassified Pseudomonas TaxID=196821 RepID=UPI000BDB143B|nr:MULTISPECIES: xylulokinase [unclassified Pseudomonas]PVZ19999.1 xylulokinase [Pseudomonas sp. URIL14HWK12:I12]PVZ27065.1 xylulokinase [Pseudomonas sp. URIL14HWK12:I10]PVZ37954.1 xylulokinase [Pseudomonas sp. URIL14HWK12:I11]SNZ05002.1 xylulokinase [Pseudomonas sp. URIL14HWK12:I9]